MGLAELLKVLLDQHPSVGVSLLLIACCGTWAAATNFTNFRWMRQNMVSKKDLEISNLKLKEDLRKTFVEREEFNSRLISLGERRRVNGEAHKH